jgi:predicted dehydrogenase
MVTINRRTFLAAGAGFTVLGASPNETIHVGVIGTGGRGKDVMGVFQVNPNVRVTAVCDVYETNLAAGQAAVEKASGHAPRAFHNYQELLADRDVDAVLIATPEHWHHRMLLDALAAGKDVYVEKPLCHTPEEGVELVKAEKASKQIIQVGMQRRSYELYLNAREVVSAGDLGKVRMVRSWWLNNYLNETAKPLEGKLDWEAWQGPAPKRPFDADRFRNWRYYSDYAGGIVADQGAHVFDGIHMLMSAGAPVLVNATAGKIHRSSVDMPESVTACAHYAEDFLAVFSINYAAMHYRAENDQLSQLDGDRARLDIGRTKFKVYERGKEDDPVKQDQSERGFSYATDLHVSNFLECVRTRKPATAPVSLGFQSSLVVQLVNISLKDGRAVRWNGAENRVEV